MTRENTLGQGQQAGRLGADVHAAALRRHGRVVPRVEGLEAVADGGLHGRPGRRVEGLEIVKTYRVLDGVAGVEYPTSTTKSMIRLVRS